MNDWLSVFLIAAVSVMSILIVIGLVRSVKGPLVADRLVGVNMIGTLVIMIISILTVLMDESWLADVACVYAMISFLAVVVLTRIYKGMYLEKKKEGEKDGR